MSAYRIILIAHLFGLAFGMGGATTIDSMFLIACRRRKISRELVDVVHAAAGSVAAAMVLLAISGAAFFLDGAEPTPKFWAKMVIVGVACLNGLAAHQVIFPLIEAASASGTGRLRLRPWPARLAAASASISGVSWAGALVLGAWRGCPLGMVPLLCAYAAILAVMVLVSATVIAPRVFEVASGRRRRKRVRSIRELRPLATSTAQSLALAVAEGALAVAKRLDERSSWPESDGFEPLTASAYGGGTSWRPAEGAREWSRRDDARAGRRLHYERFEVDDRGPWLDTRDGPSFGIYDDPEMGWR